MKPTALGSLSHIICLCGLLLFAFIFRSINPKTQKYFTALYFIYDLFIQSITTISRPRTVSAAVTRKGLTTPLTRWVASISYLCVGAVYVVLLGSPTGSITLVLITHKYRGSVVASFDK